MNVMLGGKSPSKAVTTLGIDHGSDCHDNIMANQAPGCAYGKIDSKDATIVNATSPSSSGSHECHT